MTSTRARSTWRRNWWPSPRPSAAPSISPGMSASTNSWSLPAHDAEVGFERGERVVGDLRLRRAHRRDQRRLARVREPDERGVGQQLELEPQPALFAVLALLGEARRAPRVRQEPRVAAPALAAPRREPAVAVVHEVGEQLAVAVRTTVPSGTSTTRSSPPAPCCFLPVPCVPEPALRCGWSRNASSDATLRFAAARRRRPGRRRRRRARLRHVRLPAERDDSPRRRRRLSRCTALRRRSRTSGQDTDRAVTAAAAVMRSASPWPLGQRLLRGLPPAFLAAFTARFLLADLGRCARSESTSAIDAQSAATASPPGGRTPSRLPSSATKIRALSLPKPGSACTPGEQLVAGRRRRPTSPRRGRRSARRGTGTGRGSASPSNPGYRCSAGLVPEHRFERGRDPSPRSPPRRAGRAEPLLQQERRAEGPLHRDLLVEQHAEQHRERLLARAARLASGSGREIERRPAASSHGRSTIRRRVGRQGPARD